MELPEKIETYHLIYQSIREKERVHIKELATILGYSGRGSTFETASKYLHKMYECKISLNPSLNLRTYENSYITAYFLKSTSKYSPSHTFENLAKDPKISKVIFLAGTYDFLVTTRQKDVDFKKHGVSIAKESIMYTSLFTVPKGWKEKMRNALMAFAYSTLEHSMLKREMEDFLPWENIHWDIFYSMKDDVRTPFAHVAKDVSVAADTVKKHFYKTVLPYCNVAHYFFPKGYDWYLQSLVIVESDHEKALIDTLSLLPCTSYVYILEKEVVLTIFHEGVNDVMTAFQKIEEAGYIKRHLLLVPLSNW